MASKSGFRLTTDLLFGRNSQAFHLAIQMAALQAQHFGRAADIAVILVQLFEDVVTFIGCPGLVKRRKFSSGSAPAPVAVYQGWQVFAVEPRSGRVQDHDTFDDIPQFAHVARPRVTCANGGMSWRVSRS